MEDGGGKLVDSVCVYTFFYVSLLYMTVSQEDYVCVHVFQMRTRASDNQERVRKIQPLISARSLHLSVHLKPPLPSLFITCSHLPFSYVGLFYFIPLHFPLGVSLDPAFSFSLLSPCCIYVQ